MASAGDILNDLDSFLDRLSEGEEEGGEVEDELDLGDACSYLPYQLVPANGGHSEQPSRLPARDSTRRGSRRDASVSALRERRHTGSRRGTKGRHGGARTGATSGQLSV